MNCHCLEGKFLGKLTNITLNPESHYATTFQNS